MSDSLSLAMQKGIAVTVTRCKDASMDELRQLAGTDSIAALFAQKEIATREGITPECVTCERPFADAELDDDGVCADCRLHADIRRAENLRDLREDR